MAQFTYAQLQLFATSGTVPFLNTVQNGMYRLLLESSGWVLYIMSYIILFFYRQVSNIIAKYTLPLITLFYLDFDRGPNRKTRRTRQSIQSCPIICLDYRYAVYTAYCLYPWWNFIFGGANRWYTCFSNSLDTGYERLEVPTKWFEQYAILWPPNGIITSCFMFALVLFTQACIFSRVFMYCYQCKAKETKRPWTYIFRMTFASTRKLFSNLLHQFHWTNPFKQLSVLAVYAFSSEEASLHEGMISWDTEAIPAVLDNSANTHIWNRRDDFVPGSMVYFDDNENVGVVTIGNETSRPIGIGVVRTFIRDNAHQLHETLLEKTLFFPASPVNVISVTHLAKQYEDDTGTWIKTFRNRSEFSWNHGKRFVEFHHPTSNLPVINLLTRKHELQALCTLLEQAQVAPQPAPLTTCQTCLPTDSIDGLCFVGDNIQQAQGDPRYRFTDKETLPIPLSVGNKARLTRDGINDTVTIESTRLDELTQVPYYSVELADGHAIEVTKEFLFPLNEPDLLQIPITKEQVQDHIDALDIDALEALLNPPEDTELLKEFMAWHSRLGHMPFDKMFLLGKVGMLPKRFTQLQKKKLLCPSCCIAKAKRRAWRTRAEPGKLRSKADTAPGDATSMDHVISAQPGLVPRMDSKHTRERISSGCVFFDHVSGLSYTHMQTSCDNEQTIEAKHAYERFATIHGVKLKRFHADNGIFAENAFREVIAESPGQSITYCGVGAHHQNGLVERHIGNLTFGGRAGLLHAQRRWPQAIGTILWPFAWKVHERKYNHFNLDNDGRSPAMNKFTGIDARPDVRDFHPFGCPVFVLDSKIQGKGAIPKWNPRARVGVYLGHSPCHAGSVALVLNPKTLIVSPQYHLVFDDEFSTVPFMRDGEVPPHWSELVQHSAELVTNEEFDLATTWANSYIDNDTEAALDEEVLQSPNPSNMLNQQLEQTPTSSMRNQEEQVIVPEEATPNKAIVPEEASINTRRRLRTVQFEANPLDIVNDEPTSNALLFPTMPDLNRVTSRKSTRTRKKPERYGFSVMSAKRIFGTFITCAAFMSLGNIVNIVNTCPNSSLIQQACLHVERVNTHLDGTLNQMHHLVLAAVAGDNDTYNLGEMLKQEDKGDFIQSMLKEVQDHESKGHWTLMERTEIPPGIKTILSVWSFKRKRYPDGRVLKHKARLAAHGGMQTWGVDYWETYAPVVNWLSVRTLMTMSVIHELETKSIDFVLAFPQADLKIPVWMELPYGFEFEGSRKYILRLNKNLYGLCNASKNFWDFLKDGLEARGYNRQSNSDQCVFIGKDAIVLVYVDDCIIIQKKGSTATDDLIRDLQEGDEKYTFTNDGDLEKYLGVDVRRHKDGSIELTQKHLIQRLLEVIGVTKDMNMKKTPAIKPLLFKDILGLSRKHAWNYRQAVGMLNYLSGTTRPDISMAVHQAARFCIDPRLSHERAIYRIGKYLLLTADKGIIIKPVTSKGLECYVDADFAGGWNLSDADEASSVYSRTGYVIMYAGCPVHWLSKLQSEVALSTTESEYIALSQAMRDVIPLISLLEEINEIFPIHTPTPKIHCKVWEDNNGCIVLANEGKFSPRTKHIAIKYHHFREKVRDGTIKVHPIDTKEQTADIFTKPLDESLFIHLRLKLCGW